MQQNRFKLSGAMQNEKLELSDKSSFVSDIQDYFEYIIKKLKQ